MEKYLKTNNQAEDSAPKHQSHLFIRGPIPVWWIQLASNECGPSAVIVGMLLFFWMGLRRKPALISKPEIEKWGITRNTRDKAVKELCLAQLITITKKGKRSIPVLDLESRKPLEGSGRNQNRATNTSLILQSGAQLTEENNPKSANEFWNVLIEE
jgi:hypothetical protein